MTEKQQKLLGLFKEIDSICKKHSLRYVMAGGTLLGVVRNEGFLPWDDDMDILMPRDDWNRFVQVCKTELPAHRVLSDVVLDRKFTNSFPRYGDTTGCAIHKHQIIADDVAGEVIDVFTLDPIADTEEAHRRYAVHMMIYSDLVNLGAVFGNRWDVPAHLYLKYLLMYFFLGKDRTLSRLEKILFSCREEDCSRYVMRWGGCPFLFDKDMMFPVKYKKFEGMDVMVPNHTNAYLTWHYGDEWSYVPPHSEREAHDTINLEEGSYRELRKDYMDRASRKRWFAGAFVRKLYYIATAKKRYRLHREQCLYQAKSIELDLRARLAQSEKRVEELLKAQDYAALNMLFSRYFQVQLSPAFIGREDFSNIYNFRHPIFIEIEDDLFEAAVRTLIYTERISKACRLLEIRRDALGLTPSMEKILADIITFRRAVDAFDYGSREEAEKLLDALMAAYPKVPSFVKLKCRFVMARAEGGALSEAEEFLAQAERDFPQDGYYGKYKGDLYLRQGEKTKAWELYAWSREHTANGMVHLEIEKELQGDREELPENVRACLEHGEDEKALGLVTLWQRLLPEDRLVRSYVCLAKAAASSDIQESEAALEELQEFSRLLKKEPDENAEQHLRIYEEALCILWEKLGYEKELAGLYTEILMCEETEELEALAQKISLEELQGDKKAQAHKLLGDIRMKQGNSSAAFVQYFEAERLAAGAWLKKELSLIFLRDLYRNGKRLCAYAANTEVRPLLDAWLDKYGSLSELQEFVKKLV